MNEKVDVIYKEELQQSKNLTVPTVEAPSALSEVKILNLTSI